MLHLLSIAGAWLRPDAKPIVESETVFALLDNKERSPRYGRLTKAL